MVSALKNIENTLFYCRCNILTACVSAINWVRLFMLKIQLKNDPVYYRYNAIPVCIPTINWVRLLDLKVLACDNTKHPNRLPVQQVYHPVIPAHKRGPQERSASGAEIGIQSYSLVSCLRRNDNEGCCKTKIPMEAKKPNMLPVRHEDL